MLIELQMLPKQVIKAAGKRTMWSDKHWAYDLVNGPSGKGERCVAKAHHLTAAKHCVAVSLDQQTFSTSRQKKAPSLNAAVLKSLHH